MTTPLEEQRCENCRYRAPRTFRKMTSDLNVLTRSFETQETAYFQCRRNAPQSSADKRVAAWWPYVADDDWCGEWVER